MRVEGEETQLKLQMSHRASQSMTAVSLFLHLGTETSAANKTHQETLSRNNFVPFFSTKTAVESTKHDWRLHPSRENHTSHYNCWAKTSIRSIYCCDLNTTHQFLRCQGCAQFTRPTNSGFVCKVPASSKQGSRVGRDWQW